MVRSFGSELFRRVSATVLAVLTLAVGNARAVGAQAPARPAHTVSYGVLGAVNLGAFRVVGTPTYEQRVGGAAGAWMNVPLGRFFSVEPQLQLSSIPSLQTSGLRNSAFLSEVSVRYISVPLLAKLHLKWIALSVGGQVDVPMSVVDSPNVWTVDAVAPVSAAAIGGLELFPRSRVSLYGRYSYGFTNVDGREVPDSSNAFYNQGVQAGVRIRLFGGRPRAPRAVPAKSAKVEPTPTTKPDSTVDVCLARTGADRPARCPALDTDGDGVTDDKDTCPKQAGIVKYNGCTPPDTDRDGLVDDEDRCPTVRGDREAMGCPRIASFSANAVTFEPASASLTPQGKLELDKVVDYLKLYPDITIRLSGHTDNVGTDATNNPLSQRRAEAAKEYLASKAIDRARITTEWHGSTQPTIGNGTPAGRAMNRRVEVIVGSPKTVDRS